MHVYFLIYQLRLYSKYFFLSTCIIITLFSEICTNAVLQSFRRLIYRQPKFPSSISIVNIYFQVTFGTNPISLAAPGKNEDMFWLDMATSAVAAGRV